MIQEQSILSAFSMQRLDYRFKEFTRHHWGDAPIRAVWEDRIVRVRECISELEWRSILEGVRSCALRPVPPQEFESLSINLARYGLIVAPVERVVADNGYASVRQVAREGEPFHLWCAIGRAADVRLIQSENSSGNTDALGDLLGYPACCTNFYKRVRREDGFVDTTWPMAKNTINKKLVSACHIEVPTASTCNILLKWLGVRIVFHLPCSFDCLHTEALAAKLIEIAEAAGFQHEMEWLNEIFTWPIRWSALYGLAEIASPLGTTYAATDVTAKEYRVDYVGAI